MLDLFAFIIKVILSVSFNYGIVYFLNKEDNKQLYSTILLLSILISAFITFMFILAQNIDSYICFNLSLLIAAVLYVNSSKKSNFKDKLIYLLSYISVVMISTGYIIYTFIIVIIYYYVSTNILLFSNDINKLNDDNIDIIDSEDK